MLHSVILLLQIAIVLATARLARWLVMPLDNRRSSVKWQLACCSAHRSSGG